MLIVGILLLVMSIFLIVAVLMQNGKSKRLSGTIAGGAETFFGKTKGRSIDALLSKITTVVAIIFALTVIGTYVFSNIGGDDIIVNDNKANIEDNIPSVPSPSEVDPTDPTDPTDPADPAYPADPADPADPAPVEPEGTESTEPTEPADPADPAEPVEPTEPEAAE